MSLNRYFNIFSLFRSLMITNSKNNSWKEKLLKRPVYIAILIGVLLLGTILYFNGNSNNELQPESINYKKVQKKNFYIKTF